MRRNVFLAAITVSLLVSVPAWAAPPFGSFGGKVGGGNSGAGLLPLHGWALDDDGIASVDVLVDGRVAGRAFYGRARAGVTQRFPGFPDSALPGFGFELDTTRYLNGLHRVAIRVRSRSGEVVTLEPRTFEFLNLTHNLQPFGKIEFPKAQAELRGNCDLADPARRFSVISGYALDSGTTEEDSGIGYVELLIDRAVWANSRVDCQFVAEAGGLTNCYGLRRLDIEQAFPGLKDSPHAGFRFVLDIGALISFFTYSPGSHLLTIRAGDHADQVKNIAEFPVTFTCDEDILNEESFGDIDQPRNGLLYHGTVRATGWALDWEGVQSVTVLVDGREIGNATIGFARPEISFFYPGFPESAAAGWEFSFDTRTLSNGQHFLDVLVRDDAGATTFIGKRRFVVNNVNP
ncbi:MAG TPA: Ig-like domain-containing protein [Thermoanaerobaculia bacterium]|nr:Ig-like domain-containing protein [Thermoanaerobaculia bacterium]